MIRQRLVITLITLVLASAAAVQAGTIHVPRDYPAIQDAIDAAAGGDTVVVGPGIWKENIDFLGKAITVRSSNGPQVTFIDGRQGGSVVSFTSNEGNDSVLDGFTITAGSGTLCQWPGSFDALLGGGIFCRGSAPLIRNNVITRNSLIGTEETSAFGGGIFCLDSSGARITGNSVSRNSVECSGGSADGGGIYCSASSLEIEGNSVSENSASTASNGSKGGGIFCEDSLVRIADNDIMLNEAGDYCGEGGGVYCGDCTATVEGNSITENEAETGGGLCVLEGDSGKASDVSSNVVASNWANMMGGGIYASGDTRVADNNIFLNSSHRGAAICTAGAGTIEENHISMNSGESAVYCLVSSALIRSNVISGNSATGIFWSECNPEIRDNVIMENNSLSLAGGISCHGSRSKIINNVISGNTGYDAGGISCSDWPGGTGDQPLIQGNTICNNTSRQYGGGINSCGSSVTIKENLITGSSCTGRGGGIYLTMTDAPVIANCILWKNTASYGGGILAGRDCRAKVACCTLAANAALVEGGGVWSDSSDSMEIWNTILWDNAAPAGPEIHADSGSPVVTHCDVRGGWPGTGNIDADPFFAQPAVGDFHLLSGSPCIQAGTWPVPGVDPADPDFEGDPRLAFGGADMGADEAYPHLYRRGEAVPGSAMELRIVGFPGAGTTLLGGSGVLDPPRPTPFGQLHLKWPLQSYYLGAIPGDGLMVCGMQVPPSWSSGESRPFQAFTGGMLTNLMVIDVK